MNKQDKKFLKKYIKTPSPSGYELALGGQQVWIDYVKSVCPTIEIAIDNYGNALATYPNWDKPSGFKTLKGKKSRHKTVMIDAHVDEIGFHIRDITSKGYIQLGRLGGSDVSITPSSRANIWTFGGTSIRGVFGHPAIHVQDRQFKSDPNNIFLDVGAKSAEEVKKLGIEIGNPVTMEGGYEKIGDYHCGRALDDKIGGYITARMLASLYRNDIQLDYELIVVNSVQEEVGLHGAKMIASNYDVNMAIAIDVCHCTESPAYNPSKHGSTTSGKGPVIMTGPSIHNTLSQFIFNIAKDNKIGLQRTSSGRSSGTNTDSYAYSKGVPSALLKLPLKYMHTTVEMVHEEDVEQTIEVLYQVVTSKKLTSLDLVGNLL